MRFLALVIASLLTSARNDKALLFTWVVAEARNCEPQPQPILLKNKNCHSERIPQRGSSEESPSYLFCQSKKIKEKSVNFALNSKLTV